MTKFNITLAVPAEALPALMHDMPDWTDVYRVELVKVERAEAPAPVPASAPAPQVAAKPTRRHHAGRQTTTLEVYRAAEALYRDTQASFRSVDIWRALRADGTFPTKEAVYQHLQMLRQMGLVEAVSGKPGGGGYGNVVIRHVSDEDFEAFRETIDA